MPVTYRISSDVAWLICEREFTYQEFSNALDAAIADPKYSTALPFIFDYRSYQGDTPQEAIRARADFLSLRRDKMSNRIAILVADPLHYGLGRMFEVYAGHYGFQTPVFTDLDKALEFLK